MPDWVQPPCLLEALKAQQFVDPDKVGDFKYPWGHGRKDALLVYTTAAVVSYR